MGANPKKKVRAGHGCLGNGIGGRPYNDPSDPQVEEIYDPCRGGGISGECSVFISGEWLGGGPFSSVLRPLITPVSRVGRRSVMLTWGPTRRGCVQGRKTSPPFAPSWVLSKRARVLPGAEERTRIRLTSRKIARNPVPFWSTRRVPGGAPVRTDNFFDSICTNTSVR